MLRSIAHHWISRSAAVAAALLVRSALGQIAPMPVAPDQDSTDTDKAPGFSVHKEERPVTDAFEDFERYRDKKAWEKAFGALGKIEEGKPGHLVGGKDGLFVPTDLKVRAELLSLPPEGREAYRLFNDAKAAQMLKAVAVSGPAEVAALRRLVDRYFITAVGDQAADQLGDALFEAGDFSNAQHCWQMIVENYPDSSIPTPLLQTKRAMAMARYGQWDQFEILRASLHEKYSGQTVRIGGQDVVATEVVDALQPLKSPGHSPSPGTGAGEQITAGFITKLPPDAGSIFPSSDQPVWQIPLMDTQASNQLVAQLGQTGWGAMAGQFTQAVPATAVDDKRVYVNWLGICFAADMKTGKLLWRTDSFGDMTTKMSQAMMQGTNIDPLIYSATLCDDRILFTRRSTDNQNYNELPMTRLHCLSCDAGKMIWKTDSGPLSSWGFIGQPMVSGDVFYITAHPSASQEMSLLCIGLAKGDLRWQVSLGTPAPSTNYRGVPTVPSPSMLLRSGKMMVLTNNGALLQIDMGTHQVEWALTYPAFVDNQQNYGYSPSSAVAPGTLLSVGPAVYFKEFNSNLMFAVDPSGPAIKWKRRIDPNVGLASFDGKNVLLLADELECMDADSRTLLWDSKMNTHTGSFRPVVQGDMMYLLGSKGIDAIHLGTGEMSTRFKGYDHECDGGMLWKTSNRLVTVSSKAITAYPLSK
jgi:outer membrane protein assembly factor BamB